MRFGPNHSVIIKILCSSVLYDRLQIRCRWSQTGSSVTEQFEFSFPLETFWAGNSNGWTSTVGDTDLESYCNVAHTVTVWHTVYAPKLRDDSWSGEIAVHISWCLSLPSACWSPERSAKHALKMTKFTCVFTSVLDELVLQWSRIIQLGCSHWMRPICRCLPAMLAITAMRIHWSSNNARLSPWLMLLIAMSHPELEIETERRWRGDEEKTKRRL